jgi:dTDP-4-dehydrorhamnose reductase
MTSLMITGAGGQLGTDLMAAAAAAGKQATGFTSSGLDITDADAVEHRVAEWARAADRDGERAVLINAAAYTAVDAAESDLDRAYAVNERGPRNLAEAAARHGSRLIHLSTDYVFPGVGRDERPYEVDDPTGPRSVYGASKLAGERAVLAAHPAAQVVRTAWVYGAGGPNFVKTMARMTLTHPTVSVVDDQRGSPTWSADLAAGLLQLAGRELPGGVLHATNSGDTSWFGFARAIYAELGLDPSRVHPIGSDEFPRPAPRPAYSVLSQQSWIDSGLSPLRPWRDALAAAMSADRSAYLPTG